jgi:hypothetical protein
LQARAPTPQRERTRQSKLLIILGREDASN